MTHEHHQLPLAEIIAEHKRMAGVIDRAIAALGEHAARQGAVEEEMNMLRATANDYKRQFHDLKALIEGCGYAVGYGDRGEVTLRKEDL